MSESLEEIYFSIGEPGTSDRSDGRRYQNETTLVLDYNYVADLFSSLRSEIVTRDEIDRAVFRGIVSQSVFDNIQNSELGDSLEVALSLREFGSPCWLIYLAENASNRLPLVSVDEMVRATNGLGEERASREQELQQHKDIRLTNTIEDEDQLFELWGETFGWKASDITLLRKWLEREVSVDPADRKVWFSGAYIGDVLVSAAMAERRDVPMNESGDQLALVETTEWRMRVDDESGDYRHSGIMTRNARALHEHVQADIQIPTLIYGEFNFTSRADRAGYAVGMRIPSRVYAPQMIVQNVTVCDGVRKEGIRDFTYMYLPQEITRCA